MAGLHGFFKVILQPDLGFLLLPPAVVQLHFPQLHFPNIPPNHQITLWYSEDQHWEVGFGIRRGMLSFTHGWANVVESIPILPYYWVTFTPVSAHRYDMVVYSPNGRDVRDLHAFGVGVEQHNPNDEVDVEDDSDDDVVIIDGWGNDQEEDVGLFNDENEGINEADVPDVEVHNGDDVGQINVEAQNVVVPPVGNLPPVAVPAVPAVPDAPAVEAVDIPAAEHIQPEYLFDDIIIARAKFRFPARLATLANLHHEMWVDLFFENDNGEPFMVRQEMNRGQPRFNISGWMGFVNDKGIHLGRELRLSEYSKMMRLQTYAGLSVVATLAVIYHAFSSRGQFYPATVYLSTSKVCLVLLLNMGLVIMCIMWQLTKLIFLGSLREAEVERLNEQSWREVMEILFAITIFRQDFSVTFLAMVTALLLIKSLHWLAQKRVEYIETTPTVSMLSHVRIVSFMGFLLLVDCLFLYNSVKYLIQTRQASVSLFFSFEYMILATTTISTFVKYVFYVSDMLMEGQWEKKAVYTFYLELIRDLLHLSMYLCFFLAIFVNYGVPLHLIRELYETFRNFKLRIADYIRYRKITSNMNDRFPDATPEELNASDATCIICREEMTTAKRLVCGHLFHVHCLRSWLERQHTCPICRAHVIPNEGGATTTRSQAGTHRQGVNSENTSSQDQNRDAARDENMSGHQKRVQAAAAAASIYQKSFVYPSPSTLTWSSGYALHPNRSTPGTSINNGEHHNSGLNNPANFPSFQLPQTGFIPFHASPNSQDGLNTNLQMAASQLEAQKKLIQQQIEKPATAKNSFTESSVNGGSSGEVDPPMTSSDGKGKAVASSSSSSDSGVDQSQHEKINHNHDDVSISPL
ncbi:hypothetical protein SSX86_001487 [Deinandra increscens subsp. villosa]|uniref:RING-type E3 ubiquitin transferase n=1 Tax=Deinandra increscens subsp. villosa TaxID=3103831 RepID=A0AAP0HAV2_9ASTR